MSVTQVSTAMEIYPNLLQVTGDNCVYISNEIDYDIEVDLETCYASFDEVKPFIAFLAAQICELDNAAQRFIKNRISFNYWFTTENSQLEVVFEYKENKYRRGMQELKNRIAGRYLEITEQDIIELETKFKVFIL